MPNVSSQLCSFSCGRQKTAVWFFVQDDLCFRTFCQDDLHVQVAMLLAPGHNRAAPEPSAICMLWETTEEADGNDTSH